MALSSWMGLWVHPKHTFPWPPFCTPGQNSWAWKKKKRTSLTVQWLKVHLPMQEVRVQSPVRELRSHMPHGQKLQNIKQKQYSNKFNKDSKKRKAISHGWGNLSQGPREQGQKWKWRWWNRHLSVPLIQTFPMLTGCTHLSLSLFPCVRNGFNNHTYLMGLF